MDSVVTEARPEADDRFDTARITAAVDALAEKHAGREDVFRSAHGATAEGRDDRGARDRAGGAAEGPPRPALRRTAVLRAGRDHPHPVLRRHPPSLSLADPLRRRAHGGGRHRRLWPRPDGAGIRHRSAVHPALQADRLGRAGRRGDPVLPVGHGAEGRPRHALGRRIDPAGARRHDDPHRDPRDPVPDRRPAALRRTGRALRQGSGAGHRGRIRHRQARRARGAAPPRRPVALSGRAQRQGRQGRPARPAHAVLDREIRLPRARDRRAARTRRVRRAGIPHLPPLRRFPVVGPLQHPFLLRPRRGAAVVRHAARDRDPARLHLASRHAGCRTLHEALLPGRQGRRRPHRDPVRQAGRPAGQAGAGAEPDDGAAAAEQQPAPGARQRRFHHRQQPHQSRRARRLQARPGQPDPDLPAGAEEQSRLPSRRDAHGDALAEADQHAAARKSAKPTGCSWRS